MVHASKEHIEKHYADLAGKGFFNGLVSYMSSGPVVAMIWQVSSGAAESICVDQRLMSSLPSPRNRARTSSSRAVPCSALPTLWLPPLAPSVVVSRG